MATHLIRHRWTRREFAAIEAPTFARAVEWAVRRGMSLIDADLSRKVLRGAFLAGADLRGSDISGADLSGCYLRRADLRGADLRGSRLAHAFLGAADLRQSDLRGADLSRSDLRDSVMVGADLRDALLVGAKLDGATLDWRWAAVPCEILRSSNGPADHSDLVRRLAFCDDCEPYRWHGVMHDFRSGAVSPTAWLAMTTLARFCQSADNAPPLLKATHHATRS